MPTSFTLRQLAEHVGGWVDGDPSLSVDGIATLDAATSSQIAVFHNSRYAKQVASTGAGALILGESAKAPEEMPCIRVAEAAQAYALAMQLFHPPRRRTPHRDPMAYIAPSAEVDPTSHIEAFAWIGPAAVIGADTVVEAHVRVGEGAVVGRGCHLMSGSVLCDGCALGEDVVLQPGAVVGADGFGFIPSRNGNLKVPQVGTARVEDGVELGANSCVDRAALGCTLVGAGTKTDNFVQIGHGAQVGEGCLMVAYSGIAGSSRLGARSMLGARASVLGHIGLGERSKVGACSMVARSRPEGGSFSGIPAVPHREWLRISAGLRRLPALLRKEASAVSSPLDDPALWLPHRPPFLLLDRITQLEPQSFAEGLKCVTRNDPFLAGHFPGNPVMPGVAILEAMAQLACVAAMGRVLGEEEQVELAAVSKARFRHPVRPGDRLRITAEVGPQKLGFWSADCHAHVGEVCVAEASLRVRVPPPPTDAEANSAAS
jgi:UDP-3-O-[3-hydroxymyristoyl] glucosamine N-acyltransferase